MTDSKTIGDNSEAEKRHFDAAMHEQIKLNAERATLNAKIGKARKGMKANGIVLGKLDSTIKRLEWSPQEVREDIATQQRYDAYAGLPVGNQVDLLANANDEEVARGDWRSRGRSDALRFKPAAVPKGCPPEFHQDYLAGHEEARWPK